MNDGVVVRILRDREIGEARNSGIIHPKQIVAAIEVRNNIVACCARKIEGVLSAPAGHRIIAPDLAPALSKIADEQVVARATIQNVVSPGSAAERNIKITYECIIPASAIYRVITAAAQQGDLYVTHQKIVARAPVNCIISAL